MPKDSQKRTQKEKNDGLVLRRSSRVKDLVAKAQEKEEQKKAQQEQTERAKAQSKGKKKGKGKGKGKEKKTVSSEEPASDVDGPQEEDALEVSAIESLFLGHSTSAGRLGEAPRRNLRPRAAYRSTTR